MELVSREITSQMLQQYPRGEQGNSRAWGAAQPRRPLTREQVWDKAGSHLRASPELEETLGQSLCGVYAVRVPSFPKPLPLRTVSPRSHTGFHVPQGWVEAASPHQRASPEALTCSWLCGRWVAFRTRTRPLSQAFPGSFTYHPKEALGSNLPHRQKKHSPVHDQNSYGWHTYFHSTLVHHLPCCSGAAHPSAELGPKAQGCLQVGRLPPLGTMPQGAPVARGPA